MKQKISVIIAIAMIISLAIPLGTALAIDGAEIKVHNINYVPSSDCKLVAVVGVMTREGSDILGFDVEGNLKCNTIPGVTAGCYDLTVLDDGDGPIFTLEDLKIVQGSGSAPELSTNSSTNVHDDSYFVGLPDNLWISLLSTDKNISSGDWNGGSSGKELANTTVKDYLLYVVFVWEDGATATVPVKQSANGGGSKSTVNFWPIDENGKQTKATVRYPDDDGDNTATLTVTKTVEGTGADTDLFFDFIVTFTGPDLDLDEIYAEILYLDDDDHTVIDSEKTQELMDSKDTGVSGSVTFNLQLKDNENNYAATFYQIPDGTMYKVTETLSADSIYSITKPAGADFISGTLNVTKKVRDYSVDFTNAYTTSAIGKARLELKGRKTVNEGAPSKTFSFKVNEETITGVQVAAATHTGSGGFTFTPILEFTEADIYQFVVSENAPGSGWTANTQPITIYVEVTDDQGVLSATAYKDAECTEVLSNMDLTFDNSYTSSGGDNGPSGPTGGNGDGTVPPDEGDDDDDDDDDADDDKGSIVGTRPGGGEGDDDADGDNDSDNDNDGDDDSDSDGDRNNGYRPGGRDSETPPLPTIEGHQLVPGDDNTFIELDEEGVPLGQWSYDDEEEMWIFEEFPPLGGLPDTGAGRVSNMYLLFGVSLLGMAAVQLLGRKRRLTHGK